MALLLLLLGAAMLLVAISMLVRAQRRGSRNASALLVIPLIVGFVFVLVGAGVLR